MPIGDGKAGGPIFLVSLADGRVERVLKGHPGFILSLDFSQDGARLASGETDGTARVWDPKTGQSLLEFPGHGERVRQVRFSPDGKRLAATGTDGNLRVWPADRKDAPLVIKAHKGRVNAVAWAPDGQRLATASDEGTLSLWTAAGAPVNSISTPPKPGPFLYTSLAFKPDGQELLYTAVQEVGRVGLLTVPDLKARLTFDKHDNTVFQGVIARDGGLVVTAGGESNPVIVWRPRDGSVLHTLQGNGRSVMAVGWGADGKSLAFGNTNGPGVLRHARPLERTFRLDEFDLGAAPAADVTRPLVDNGDWALEMADQFRVNVKRKGQRAFTLRCPHPNEQVYSGTLLPGSSYLVLGGQYGVYGIDLNDPRRVHEHVGHTYNVTAAAPSPDGKHFVTGSMDQTLRVWKPGRDEPLLSLFVAGSEWIAWTPEGYYAASPYGERLIGWRVNNGPDQLATCYPAIQFHASLFQPDVVRRLLSAGSLQNAIAQVTRERKKPLVAVNLTQVMPPTVSIVSPQRVTGGVKVAGNTVEVKARARSTGNNPVTAFRLLLDGRPYEGQAGVRAVPQPKLGEAEASWTVQVPPGWHLVAVLAESAVSKGVSSPVELVTADTGDPPALYMVAVGISAYPGRMRLHYAASDAVLLKDTFEQKARGAFKKVEIHLVTDKEATRARIVKELEWLKSVMTPRDVAIFSFSGHGARDDDDTFYLVPVDANPRDIAHTLLPGEVVSRHLAALPGKVVALLDACHSGSVAVDMRISRPDSLARVLVSDETGVVVMCSSLGSEYSLESPATKAGFFTLSISEGLAGAADLNKDGVVYIHELDHYAGRRVRELSRGLQHPTTGRPPGIRPFPLARTGQ
jgi:WD40 repeat protein